MPGIRHRYLTDTALLAMENDRFDCFYIMDIEERDVTNAPVTDPTTQNVSVRYTSADFRNRGLNSSFGAAYFPDVNIKDTTNRTIERVPPSVAVLGAFGKNDALGHPWFAPAGFTRGTMNSVEDATLLLSRANMDDLQTNNINPIVAFAGQGPTVYGQKTLLASESALDRVNVRRMLLSIRREVKKVSNQIMFEPLRESTLASFQALVNPILKRVQDLGGLENFRVLIDTSTTSQLDIENKTIRGKIFVVPTKTLEFMSLDFVLTNRGNFISG
jgi:phage tail sheath protein FI